MNKCVQYITVQYMHVGFTVKQADQSAITQVSQGHQDWDENNL